MFNILSKLSLITIKVVACKNKCWDKSLKYLWNFGWLDEPKRKTWRKSQLKEILGKNRERNQQFIKRKKKKSTIQFYRRSLLVITLECKISWIYWWYFANCLRKSPMFIFCFNFSIFILNLYTSFFYFNYFSCL